MCQPIAVVKALVLQIQDRRHRCRVVQDHRLRGQSRNVHGFHSQARCLTNQVAAVELQTQHAQLVAISDLQRTVAIHSRGDETESQACARFIDANERSLQGHAIEFQLQDRAAIATDGKRFAKADHQLHGVARFHQGFAVWSRCYRLHDG